MLAFMILCCNLVFSIHIDKSLAQELDGCSEPVASPKLCLTGDGYVTPVDIVEDLPISVQTTANLYDIINVDTEKHSMTVHLDLGLIWNDTSISFATNDSDDDGWYEIQDWEAKLVWKPSIRFLRMLGIKRATAFGGTFTNSFWFQKPNRLSYNEELQVTVSCEFQFSTFPYDSHICDFDFGDQVMETTYLLLETVWLYHSDLENNGVEPIAINRARLPFEMILSPKESFAIYLASYDTHYSFTGIQVQLIRNNRGKLFAGYYLLTGVFAMLSTLSFTITPEQVPGRMGLLVTLYLITANTYSSIDAPKDRGFSHIELWMCGVQFPMLLALLEFGYLLWSLKFKSPKSKVEEISFDKKGNAKNVDPAEKLKENHKRLDKVCIVICIVYMAIFNLFYWNFI